jgi:Mg2+/Co2+ transporter CorB
LDPDPPSLILSFISLEFSQVLSLVMLIVLLICSALISGAEVAFFSLTPADFLSDNGKRTNAQKIVVKLLEKPKKLLATILVANNTINIAIVLLFDSFTDEFFGNLNAVVFGINFKFLIEVGIVTFLILLFGEILPKVYASRNNVKFSNLMAIPLNVLDFLISPLSTPMRAVTIYIHDKLGKQKGFLSVDHLSQALEMTRDEDTTHEEQKI